MLIRSHAARTTRRVEQKSQRKFAMKRPVEICIPKSRSSRNSAAEAKKNRTILSKLDLSIGLRAIITAAWDRAGSERPSELQREAHSTLTFGLCKAWCRLMEVIVLVGI